jgi:hypothetical protein
MNDLSLATPTDCCLFLQLTRMEYNRNGRRYYSVGGYPVRDGASCDWREWVKVPMPFSPVRGLS